MNISLLHPSWKRPQLAFECYCDWVEKAYDTSNFEYILCLSDRDPYLEEYKQKFSGCNVTITILEGNNGLVPQVNQAAKLSQGNILIAVSDDFSCPDIWDRIILSALYGKSDYIVKTLDGAQDWIITLPFMDRAYYNRFGYIYHPSYLHMFCDTDITHVGDLLGRIIKLDVLFPHNHYTTGKTQFDGVNLQNDQTWAQGEALYFERIKTNFDLPTESIVNKLDPNLPHVKWLESKGIIL